MSRRSRSKRASKATKSPTSQPSPRVSTRQGQEAITPEKTPARAAPTGTGDVARSWYIDVGGSKIQTWLGRTTALGRRRGASTALAACTSRATIETILREQSAVFPVGLGWNGEAGEISGVVSLSCPDSDDFDRSVAARVAGVIADQLRMALPELPITARYGRAATYAAAYDGDMATRALDEGLLLDIPGLFGDHPLAKPCDLCRASAARSTPVTIDGARRQICQDCQTRYEQQGRATAFDVERMPRSQADLLLRIAGGRGTVDFPDDFEGLAQLCRPDQGQEATQLATVFADGNRVGALIKAMLTTKGDGLPHVVTALDAATKGAIAAAAQAHLLFDVHGTTTVGAFVHLAGGDDVLMTVPASRAWAFVRTLCASFENEAEQAHDGRGPLTKMLNGTPSLSVGLVFHHDSDPFAEVLERADLLLKAAKRKTLGRSASVAFEDFDLDGQPLPTSSFADLGRRPTLAERSIAMHHLDQRAALLTALAEVPRSQRQTLRQLTAAPEDDTQLAAFSERGETWQAALARRVVTMSIPAVIACVAGPGGGAADAEILLADPGPEGSAARVGLRLDLDIARWWSS